MNSCDFIEVVTVGRNERHIMNTSARITCYVLVATCLTCAAPLLVGCSATATRSSTGEYVDDSVLTAKVKTELARDKDVNGFAVNVETYRGVVQLSGFVDSVQQKEQAALAANRVSGVVDVQNNISVKPPPRQP